MLCLITFTKSMLMSIPKFSLKAPLKVTYMDMMTQITTSMMMLKLTQNMLSLMIRVQQPSRISFPRVPLQSAKKFASAQRLETKPLYLTSIASCAVP